MSSDQKDKEAYNLSNQDKKRLHGLLNERRSPTKKGPLECEKGEIPDALEDEIGIELMEYILEEDEQYKSSQNIAEYLDLDVSTRQVGHRIRMIGNSLGLEKDDVGQFYSSNTTWNLNTLRSNSLDKLYDDARNIY